MSASRPLSLDHITVVDATPSQLVETAAAVGCGGICTFLHAMPVLPAMPNFTIVGDTPERRQTRQAMCDTGVTLDLVYPFTLTGRTVIADFAPALESTAWLGGRLANVLCYDRDPVRRVERLGELAMLARSYGIGLAIEFYPPSQIGSLAEALATIDAIPDQGIGVTLDLLHLVRAGEDAGPALADPRIRFAQISDGPMTIAAERIEWEAGSQRLLPGSGCFDIRAFIRSLPRHISLSVEVPQETAIRDKISQIDRAAAAVSATRAVLAGSEDA